MEQVIVTLPNGISIITYGFQPITEQHDIIPGGYDIGR
jgi:hypothetical protein